MARYDNRPHQIIIQSQQSNSLGVASMVIGVVAIAFCWMPFLSIPIAVLGLLLGGLGFLMSIIRGGTGIGYCIAGAGLSGLALGIWTFFIAAAGTGIVAANKQAADELKKQGGTQDVSKEKKGTTVSPPDWVEYKKPEPAVPIEAAVKPEPSVAEPKSDAPKNVEPKKIAAPAPDHSLFIASVSAKIKEGTPAWTSGLFNQFTRQRYEGRSVKAEVKKNKLGRIELLVSWEDVQFQSKDLPTKAMADAFDLAKIKGKTLGVVVASFDVSSDNEPRLSLNRIEGGSNKFYAGKAAPNQLSRLYGWWQMMTAVDFPEMGQP